MWIPISDDGDFEARSGYTTSVNHSLWGNEVLGGGLRSPLNTAENVLSGCLGPPLQQHQSSQHMVKSLE